MDQPSNYAKVMEAIRNPRPAYDWNVSSEPVNQDKEIVKKPDEKIPLWLKGVIAVNPIANAADLITTEKGLRDGGTEANPFMRSNLMKYGVKPAYSLGTAYYATKLAKQGKKKEAVLASLIPTVLAGVPAILNATKTLKRR